MWGLGKIVSYSFSWTTDVGEHIGQFLYPGGQLQGVTMTQRSLSGRHHQHEVTMASLSPSHSQDQHGGTLFGVSITEAGSEQQQYCTGTMFLNLRQEEAGVCGHSVSSS